MTCSFNGSEYSEGSLICANGRELKCSGGAWQETGYSCQTISNLETEYTIIENNNQLGGD